MSGGAQRLNASTTSSSLLSHWSLPASTPDRRTSATRVVIRSVWFCDVCSCSSLTADSIKTTDAGRLQPTNSTITIFPDKELVSSLVIDRLADLSPCGFIANGGEILPQEIRMAINPLGGKIHMAINPQGGQSSMSLLLRNAGVCSCQFGVGASMSISGSNLQRPTVLVMVSRVSTVSKVRVRFIE